MNVLSKEKQVQVISAIVEGNSIRSTERMTGVHRDIIKIGHYPDPVALYTPTLIIPVLLGRLFSTE